MRTLFAAEQCKGGNGDLAHCLSSLYRIPCTVIDTDLRPRSKQAEWAYKLREGWVKTLQQCRNPTPLVKQMLSTWQVAKPNHIPGLFLGVEDAAFCTLRSHHDGNSGGTDSGDGSAGGGSGGSGGGGREGEGGGCAGDSVGSSSSGSCGDRGGGSGGSEDGCVSMAQFVDSAVTTDGDIAKLLAGCSAIVGLHPDEPTAAIIDCATLLNKNWAVVPCCVFSSKFPSRKVCGRFKPAAGTSRTTRRESTGCTSSVSSGAIAKGNGGCTIEVRAACACLDLQPDAVLSTAACRHAAASSGGDGSDNEVAISRIDGDGAPTTAAVVECGCAPVRSYEDLVLHLAARGAGTELSSILAAAILPSGNRLKQNKDTTWYSSALYWPTQLGSTFFLGCRAVSAHDVF